MNLKGYQSSLDRGAPAWKEALWLAVKPVLFLAPVPLPSALRADILRAFGARLESGLVIRSGVDITFPWRLTCGHHTWLGEGCKILNLAPVHLGSNVCLSQQAFLCTGSHDHKSAGFDLITRPITIADECWVGARAFVAPGVTVGQGSVVSACAVVVKDIPPGHLATGNPAKFRLIDDTKT